MIPFEDIDAGIDSIVKNLGKDVMGDYKEFMENEFFFSTYGRELELNIVIDANAVLAEAYAYVKYGKSYLFDLMQSPFLKITSPEWLHQELEKNISKFSKEKNLEEKEFKEAVGKITSKIKIIKVGIVNPESTILKRIKDRDAKDMPYVAVYVEKKSHGILTKDRDIADMPNVRTWRRPGEVGKVIRIFEKGAFAYVIIGNLPIIFTLLGELCILILRAAWEVIKTAAELLIEAAAGAMEAVSKLPDWAKIVALIGTILLLAWDQSRNFIVDKVKQIGKWLVELLKLLYEGLKSILNVLQQGVIMGGDIILALFTEVDKTITYYEQINN